MTKKEQTNAMVAAKNDTATISVFSDVDNFKNALFMAEKIAKSDIIPASFKGKPENCLVALEMSNRMKMPVMQIFQNLYVIQGRPCWSSSFIIACINKCGKYTDLQFEYNSEAKYCYAWAISKATGERIEGPKVSMKMAQDEGWLTKNGSKWKTMPDLMLRYRAAAFFGRVNCPEVINGMLTDDEAKEIPQEKEITIRPEIIDVFEEVKPAAENKPAMETMEIPQEPMKEQMPEQIEMELANAAQ
jgi:hypothetical protein